ncbi:hypothetical protein WN943_015449 [Citrus x changshan-huyou]
MDPKSIQVNLFSRRRVIRICDNCRQVYSVDVIAPGRALRMEDSVNGKGSSHNVSIDLESAQFCVQVKGYNESKQQTHLIFSYGTLKRGFPNHYLMQQLMDQNAAVFLGPYCTHESYPLVCGPYNIPYLINLPRSGNRVKGELYSVSTQGLARLDELEGTRFGHYERLPIRLAEGGREGNDGNGAVSVAAVEAEGYFLNRSFGEGLWEKKGKVGMNEYTEYEGQEYVAIDKRAKGVCIVDEIASFLSSD